MARRKVKNGEKNPWGQCLTRPVPNGRPHYLPLGLRGWWIALSTFRTSGAWLLVQMLFTELQEVRGSYYSFCLNWHISRAHKRLENRRHFATPPTVSPRNDVWEKSAEIPYWWHVIWVVLLIGWGKFHKAARLIRSSTQIWVVMLHEYGIFSLVSQTSFREETVLL